MDTGFRSLRELMAFALGGWAFWWQVTRAAHPDIRVLVASVLLITAPTLTAVYRTVNAILGAGGRIARELERDQEREAP